MLQIVRRQSDVSPVSFMSRAMPFISRKERRLEIAFLSLAATNLFVVSSGVAFYLLAHTA